MKKVIFICLLSLSMCLSKPAEQQGDPVPTPTSIATTKNTDNKTVDVVPTKQTITNQTTLAPKVEPGKQTVPNTSEPAHNETNAVPTEAPKADADKDNKSTKTSPPPITVPSKTDKPTPAAEPVKTNTTAKPEVTPTTAVTTHAPPANPDNSVNVQARHFDGPSFIGGIILTLGMLAIGFMGFKYYKNQTERNYHTL